jgi:hypothetical protein
MHLPLEIIQLIKEECDLRTQQEMTKMGLGWLTEKERIFNLAEYYIVGQKEYRLWGYLNKSNSLISEDEFREFLDFTRCLGVANDIYINHTYYHREVDFYLKSWYEYYGKKWDGYEFYHGPINMKIWVEQKNIL